MILPWLLDLQKGVALVAGKSAGSLIRGPSLSEEERQASMVKWLSSQLLEAGVVLLPDEIEKEASLHLPELIQQEVGRPPLIRSDSQKNDVSPQELLNRVFHASQYMRGVTVEPFPVMPDVQAMVDETVITVFAALVRHNLLDQVMLDYVKACGEGNAGNPPEVLSHQWRTAHKLRRWLLQRYQAERNRIATEQEAKRKEEEEKSKKGDFIEGNEEKKEVVDEEPDRATLYAEICGEIRKRCLFLLCVIPVQPQSSSPLLLDRKVSSKDGQEMTEEQKKARNLLLAWQSTKDSVPLREATAEERSPLVWKIVLGMIDDSALELDKLKNAVLNRRQRAILRAAGIRSINALITSSSLDSVKREIAVSLVSFIIISSLQD